MKIRWWVLSALTASCFLPVRADIIFSQDFSSAQSASVSPFINAAPNSGQWDAINRDSTAFDLRIANGALSYTRSSAGIGWFSRTVDFNPKPAAMIYSFDLNVTGNSVSQPSGATAIWEVGSGFSTTKDLETTYAHSRFGITLSSNPGYYQFRDAALNSSADFHGALAITWVINNSGSTLSYLGPDNLPQTVADDTWDLWAGETRVFNDKAADHATRSLADLKFVFDKGFGTITMDNFRIEDRVELVPEPALTGALSVGFLALILAGRTMNRTRRRSLQESTEATEVGN